MVHNIAAFILLEKIKIKIKIKIKTQGPLNKINYLEIH